MRTDPRGPVREVVAVEVKPNGNFIRFTCGHVGHHNPIYMPPRVGDKERCFHCTKDPRP